tara:strand:- start:622 stop:954 length:333 start_codon:yes stop_codon:yes gene_type:complete
MTKQIRIIGFIQDDYDTVDEMKLPLPDDYLSKCDFMPDNIREEMFLPKNSWTSKIDGNIHFSRHYNPDPFIGTDNEVYLYLGDLTLECNHSEVFARHMKGMKLLEQVGGL